MGNVSWPEKAGLLLFSFKGPVSIDSVYIFAIVTYNFVFTLDVDGIHLAIHNIVLLY